MLTLSKQFQKGSNNISNLIWKRTLFEREGHTMKRWTSALIMMVATASMAEAQRPNFVIIFIDDMGYGDIGPFGSEINATPRLDRMAAEGMKLTSFYVASSVCTPSRSRDSIRHVADSSRS